ncbi:MAG: LytTR family DNA-binding domain-containing protein [Bacteroidota bacterium]
MEAIIVEDESLSAERLHHLVRKIDVSIKITNTLNSMESAIEWFRDNSHPDLIFLDIQLGDGSAFDFLEEINVTSSIIFTTAFDEYAIRAFKFNSIDYLLKPIDQGALTTAIGKFRDQSIKTNKRPQNIQAIKKIIKNDYQKRFLIKVGEQYKNLQVEDIAFFSSYDGHCYVTTNSGDNLPIDHSLDQLVDRINPLDFFRVNRQFIANSESIHEIHTYFNSRLVIRLRPNNTEVIVSRDRVNDFKHWLDS